MVSPRYNHWRVDIDLGTETGAYSLPVRVQGPGFEGIVTPIINTASEHNLVISHTDAQRLRIPVDVLQSAVVPIPSMTGFSRTFRVRDVSLSFMGQGLTINAPPRYITVVNYVLDDMLDWQKEIALSRQSSIGRGLINSFEWLCLSGQHHDTSFTYLDPPRF